MSNWLQDITDVFLIIIILFAYTFIFVRLATKGMSIQGNCIDS